MSKPISPDPFERVADEIIRKGIRCKKFGRSAEPMDPEEARRKALNPQIKKKGDKDIPEEDINGAENIEGKKK